MKRKSCFTHAVNTNVHWRQRASLRWRVVILSPIQRATSVCRWVWVSTYWLVQVDLNIGAGLLLSSSIFSWLLERFLRTSNSATIQNVLERTRSGSGVEEGWLSGHLKPVLSVMLSWGWLCIASHANCCSGYLLVGENNSGNEVLRRRKRKKTQHDSLYCRWLMQQIIK